VVAPDAFASKPTLTGERVRLVPLGPEHAATLHRFTGDPETNRLTGTHRTFTRAEIDAWCASRAEQPDRLDLAIEAIATGKMIGDVAVMDLDPPNASAGFRIALGPGAVGQGLGTEATRLVVAHLLDVVGLHRVQLEVYAFNERARRSYERCGFEVEGRLRDALRWDGAWHDALVMAVVRA
jgi:RimJ/RimL family protein N-acetyltransferase